MSAVIDQIARSQVARLAEQNKAIRVRECKWAERLTILNLIILIGLAASYYLPTHYAMAVSSVSNILWLLHE